MKPVIVYYSYSGITRRELQPQQPYSFSYNTAVKEVREEIEKGYCPPLMRGAEAIGNAEVIFVGSPNWLKTFAPPVRSFLRTVDLDGKTIIPFCTHGGGGFGRMIEDYKRECEHSIIKDGIALKGDYSFDELKAWLDHNL